MLSCAYLDWLRLETVRDAVPTYAQSLPRDVYSIVSDHLIEGRPAPRPNMMTFLKPRVHVIGVPWWWIVPLFSLLTSLPDYEHALTHTVVYPQLDARGMTLG